MEERDTDRLASELLGALRDALGKPLPGTGQAPSQAQVDERSLLDTIKEFLTQSLPGTKDKEEPKPGPAAPIPGSAEPKPLFEVGGKEKEKPEYEPVAAGSGAKESWEALRDRQEQEREAMHERHEQEREAMHFRHEREREAVGYARERDKEEDKREQEARKREHEQAKDRRGHGRGRD